MTQTLQIKQKIEIKTLVVISQSRREDLGENFCIKYKQLFKLPNYNYTFLKENYNNYLFGIIVKFNLKQTFKIIKTRNLNQGVSENSLNNKFLTNFFKIKNNKHCFYRNLNNL